MIIIEREREGGRKRETERQRDRETERQRDRERQRQRQRQREVHIYTCNSIVQYSSSTFTVYTTTLTSSGSSIPFLVTIICLGCSSTGSDLIRAATSSAVFHFASCPRRFCPAHTEVWMIFRKSWPVRGLKMKMAPLIGLVVKLPSNV